MPKTSKAPSRKLLGEKGVAKELIGDFKPDGSRGLHFLEYYFGKNLYVNRLISLGSVFSKICNIKLPRNYRNKELLILWFDKNIDIIEPFKDNVKAILENIEGLEPTNTK